jgi:hypothetical protein
MIDPVPISDVKPTKKFSTKPTKSTKFLNQQNKAFLAIC